MAKIYPTMGYGLLESFLAKQRAKIADCLLKEIPNQRRILDIGCGNYPLFLKKNKFKEKFGIDKIISKKNINIKLISYDIEKRNDLPFANNYFDAITMLAVIEHIKPDKLISTFKEIKRILRNNGIFVITTPAGWTDKLLKQLSKFYLVSPQEIAGHKDIYNHQKILDILEKSGFDKRKIWVGYFELGMNIWVKAKK